MRGRANARLLKVFPEGFALDASHHPHITMLQQFVRTDGTARKELKALVLVP
jgi:hypothetical protein